MNTNSAVDRPLCLNQEQLLLSREWMRRHANVAPSLTPTALTLQGRLNYNALERTLNEIVSRHAGLRVRIYPAPGMGPPEKDARLLAFARGIYQPGFYRQSVVENVSVEIRRIDLDGLHPDAADETIQTTLLEEATEPFNYEKPPLARVILVRRRADNHLLIVTLDHAVADGWSMRILRSELALLYEHYSGAGPYPLPEPGLHYPDYATWQHEAMAGSYFASSADYWSRQWTNFGRARIATRELPFAAPAAQRTEVPFGVERADLGPDTCQAIRKFARQSRITLNIFFLAAYATVLHAYTRKARLALWGHFSNRGRAEFQNTVGYFVHSHLIGIDFSLAPTAGELLQQVRSTVLDAMDHQEMPLPYLWQRLNCWPRYADARILMDYHAPEKGTARSSNGLIISRAKLREPVTGRFSSLGVYVTDNENSMSLSVQYSKDRFAQTPVKHLLEDLQVVIAGWLANPDQKVSAILDRPRYAGSPAESASEMGEFVVLDQGQIASVASLVEQNA